VEEGGVCAPPFRGVRRQLTQAMQTNWRDIEQQMNFIYDYVRELAHDGKDYVYTISTAIGHQPDC